MPNKSQIMDIVVPSDRMFDISSGDIADPPNYDDIGNKFFNTAEFLGPGTPSGRMRTGFGADMTPTKEETEAASARISLKKMTPVLKPKVEDIMRHGRLHGLWNAKILDTINDKNPKHPWNVYEGWIRRAGQAGPNLRVIHPTVGTRAVVSDFTPEFMAKTGYTDVAGNPDVNIALEHAHKQYPEAQYMYRIMRVNKSFHVFVKNKAKMGRRANK